MAMDRCWKRSLAILGALTVVQGLAMAGDFEGPLRAKAQFLCQWRQQRNLTENTWRLDICDNPALPIGTMLVQLDGWWGYWFEHRGLDGGQAVRDQFAADWERSPQHQAILDEDRREKQRKLDRAKAARQREIDAQAAADRQFDASVGASDSAELCIAYHQKGRKSARAELERRKALTTAEWTLIARSQIGVGMSELALFCSWGQPKHTNRTVNAAGEYKQYVYDDGFVYVERDRVTSYQDSK